MSVGKFVMTKGKAWSGLTLKNHIGAIFGTQPQLVSPLTTVLLQNSGMKNLDTTLALFPEKVLNSSDDFVWKVVGSDERNIPLVEARFQGAVVAGSDTGIGVARTTFDLVFAEKWFTKQMVIAGPRPDVYQIRIVSDEPMEEGSNYVYTCEVWGGQESLAGIPGDELVAGNRFSIESAYVEDELSTRGAGIQFTSPWLMRNSVSTLRMEVKVSGAMIDMKVEPVYFAGIETRDPNTGGVHKSVTWMQEVMWQFERQFSKIKSKTLMFGKTNRDENGRFLNKGQSNIEIKAGSGIREQMEVSNTITYNRFSMRLLEDALSELSEGKLDWGERKFMLRTGERGAAQFNRAATAAASGWKSLFDNTNMNAINKVTSKFNDNAFEGGFQFTEWRAPNNIHIMLEVDPMYDDKVRNKILHPDGGVAESYRYDILYIGSMEEPNIQKIKVRGDDELRGYMAGIRDPFSGRRGGIMQLMEDSATMTAMCGTGAMVKDSSRTLTLKPAILD
jgi:hypothetical protein